MRVVVLGSGTSMGVPVLGCSCKVCTSSDPRDKRTRVAAVIDGGDGGRILIDTPPELRLQLLSADVGTVDAVLFTHDHADHVHGIDDLRAISQRNGELPLYGPQDTLDRIVRRFDYIFDPAVVAPEGTYKPDLSPSPLKPGEPVKIAGIDVLPIELSHGVMTVFGYRFGPFAYLTDVKSVPDDALASLSGVRVLVSTPCSTGPTPRICRFRRPWRSRRGWGPSKLISRTSPTGTAIRIFPTGFRRASSQRTMVSRLPSELLWGATVFFDWMRITLKRSPGARPRRRGIYE